VYRYMPLCREAARCCAEMPRARRRTKISVTVFHTRHGLH
jgi:hypothetical protein